MFGLAAEPSPRNGGSVSSRRFRSCERCGAATSSSRGSGPGFGRCAMFAVPSPIPPILVGANGPKMAAVAGRHADGVNVHSWESDLAGLVAVARHAATAAGRVLVRGHRRSAARTGVARSRLGAPSADGRARRRRADCRVGPGDGYRRVRRTLIRGDASERVAGRCEVGLPHVRNPPAAGLGLQPHPAEVRQCCDGTTEVPAHRADQPAVRDDEDRIVRERGPARRSTRGPPSPDCSRRRRTPLPVAAVRWREAPASACRSHRRSGPASRRSGPRRGARRPGWLRWRARDPMIVAVSRARANGLVQIAPKDPSSDPASAASRRPASLSGGSSVPCQRPMRFHSLSACRSNSTFIGVRRVRSAVARRDSAAHGIRRHAPAIRATRRP